MKVAKTPYLFDDYFELGGSGTSPFLTPNSRQWGRNLSLKTSLFAALLLVVSFVLYLKGQTPYSDLLLTIVYFFVGIPSLIDSVNDLFDLDVNIDVLMTLAAFSSILLGSPMEGALLLVLFEVSHALEHTVSDTAKGSIRELHRLSPSRANVVKEDGTLMEKSVRDIEVGTKIFVKARQVVPLDGEVIKGSSFVNLVHLTGENLPVPKTVGDQIAAGSRNLDGALTLRVTHSNSDSTLARIIQLVTTAQQARPKLQRWFDRLSKRYATSIILFSAFFALLLPLFSTIPYLGNEGSVYRALAFLIAASPCALIIAIPIAYLSAVSACARQGILVKGGVTLDATATCEVIAFDKTGTLTTGELTCVGIESFGEGLDEKKALAIAHTLEQGAVHPVAKAILKMCQEKNIPPAEITDFRSVPGYGVEGKTIEGEKAFIGSSDYVRPYLTEIEKKELDQKGNRVKKRGELLAVLLIGKRIMLLRFRDTPRSGAKQAVAELEDLHKFRLLMLTGDHRESAKNMAAEFGIKEFYSDLKPEDKLDHVTQLSQKKGLAMVGDGVNDAPALARATVGISMGKVGSGAAVEAADIVLLQDDLSRLGWLFRKSLQTQRIVRQNLFIAAGAILVATTPALLGVIPLWLAVVLHEGGTVLVGLNALRLLRS